MILLIYTTTSPYTDVKGALVLYIVQCMYTLHVYNVHCTLHNVQCTLYV